jgi:hypothetical protein
MGKQQVNTGKGNTTINTNNVWERIVALENGIAGVPSDVSQQLSGKADKTIVDGLVSSLAEKAKKKNNIVYVTDLLAENPATPIETVINQLFVANKTTGIKVIVDTPITISSSIIMQNCCTLEGVTRKLEIKLANNANCNMIDWNYSAKAFIRNLSLNGNNSNNTTGNGIVCGNASQPTNNAVVDGSLIENVNIWQCAEDGLQCIYPIWSMSFNRITIGYCNGFGLYNTGTDNFFSDIYIMYCGKTTSKPVGMYFYGSNNKMNNAKVIFSGLTTGATGLAMGSSGVRIGGASQQITNLEAQENLNSGITLDTVTHSNITMLADANSDKIKPHVAGSFGVKLFACTDNNLDILCTNYCYSIGYYQDQELNISTGNKRNNIRFTYGVGFVNIPLVDVNSTPEDGNVINGYSQIHYTKLSKISAANMVGQPIPDGSSYWTLNNGITATSGLITATQANQDFGKLLSLTAGKVYLARIDFSSLTGNWIFRAETQTDFSSPTQYTFSNSMHMIINQTTTANRNLLFRCTSASGNAQVTGIALIDITTQYNNLKNYYGEGTIGRLLATDSLNSSTITL